MRKVVSLGKLVDLVKKLKNQGKKIVLVGGCFDVLHPGHVIFLEKAKKAGGILVILLEPDQKVKALKGVDRPIHTQKMRAKVLSALQAVDFCLMLPLLKSEAAYDKVIQKIQPDIIAATQGYRENLHHQRAAQLVGARLKYVTKVIANHSTSRILSRSD